MKSCFDIGKHNIIVISFVDVVVIIIMMLELSNTFVTCLIILLVVCVSKAMSSCLFLAKFPKSLRFLHKLALNWF